MESLLNTLYSYGGSTLVAFVIMLLVFALLSPLFLYSIMFSAWRIAKLNKELVSEIRAMRAAGEQR